MQFYKYKLKFVYPIHIRNGKLYTSDITINADTIFSPMCIQLCKMYGKKSISDFVKHVRDNKLVISDAMPYYKDDYYIRKPILPSFCENITNEMEEKPEKIIKKLNNKKMINLV